MLQLSGHKIESVIDRPEKHDLKRPTDHPYYDATKSRIIATNGKALVVVPVASLDDTQSDASGPIPVDALKAARKHGNRQRLSLNGDARLLDGTSLPRPESNGTYPDVDSVIPPAPEEGRVPDLCIDADLLYRLAQAIASDGKAGIVDLYFNSMDRAAMRIMQAIRVHSRNSDGAIGVIMSCRPPNE